MLEISFFPTSARASSAASPEGPVLPSVVSSTTLFSERSAACGVLLLGLRSLPFPRVVGGIVRGLPSACDREEQDDAEQDHDGGLLSDETLFELSSRALGTQRCDLPMFSGKGIYEAEDTMDLAARLCSDARPGATARGVDLQEVWTMHHWVLLLVWVRIFREEAVTDGQGGLTQSALSARVHGPTSWHRP